MCRVYFLPLLHAGLPRPMPICQCRLCIEFSFVNASGVVEDGRQLPSRVYKKHQIEEQTRRHEDEEANAALLDVQRSLLLATLQDEGELQNHSTRNRSTGFRWYSGQNQPLIAVDPAITSVRTVFYARIKHSCSSQSQSPSSSRGIQDPEVASHGSSVS